MNRDNGSGAVAERKPSTPDTAATPATPATTNRSLHVGRPDPGAFITQPRARGSEGFTQAAWPVAAVLLVPGVAALAYGLFHDAAAMMTGGLVTVLLILVVDHYVD